MESVEKWAKTVGFEAKKAFLRPKRGRGSKLSTGHSTDVEKLAVVNVGFHLLAAPKVVAALRGEERGEAPGLGDYRQRCDPFSTQGKVAAGARRVLGNAQALGGYNRGRTAATPIEPLGGPLGENCETYLSAEHAPPSKDSRFSSADAHPSGSGGDCAAQAKGPGPTHPLRLAGSCRRLATDCAQRPTSDGFFEKEKP
jgi:hypothetical protein